MESGTENRGKNLISWKILIKKYYFLDYYVVSINKYGIKCRTSLRFWENKWWVNKIDPYGWFQWYLGTGRVENWKMMKDKLIDGKKL